MAIDTANKRNAVIGFGGLLQAIPLPDGTIDAFDRGMLLHGYYIAPAEVAESTGYLSHFDGFRLLAKRRRMVMQ